MLYVDALLTLGSWKQAVLTFGDTAPASGILEFHDTHLPPGQAFYRTVQP